MRSILFHLITAALCLSLSTQFAVVSAADPEVVISKTVPPDFVTNYADYGPIDLPIVLKLTVAAASPWRLNNDGTVTGGLWAGGPSNFYTYAFAGYIGAHVGKFHGTLSRDGNGSGGQPPEWNGEARDVAMYIGDESHNYISPNSPYAVGEKIILTLNPASENPTDIAWNINGTVIKNYTQTVQAATITALAPADLTTDTVSYYYFTGGTKSISVSYKVRGKPGSRTRNLDIKAPTLISYTSTTGSFSLVESRAADILRFGTISRRGTPGILWKAKLKGPEIYDGQFKFVQTAAPDKAVQLDPTRINQSTDANGWMHFRGTYGLDTRLSYGGAAPVALGANQTAMGGSNDNPSVGSAKAITLIEKDQFIQYCMYKPNTPDSIWVAVGRLIWGCDGTVSRPTKFDPWGAVTGGATPVSPSGAAYNGPPPEWTVVWNSSTPYAPGP